VPQCLFVAVAKALLWSKPLADFQKQLAEVAEAKGWGFIRPTLVLPPMLNNSEKTDTYLAGEASTMKDAMGVTNFVSRTSMADLCLKLGGKGRVGGETTAMGRRHKPVVASTLRGPRKPL
jgi:hypothetical protein